MEDEFNYWRNINFCYVLPYIATTPLGMAWARYCSIRNDFEPFLKRLLTSENVSLLVLRTLVFQSAAPAITDVDLSHIWQCWPSLVSLEVICHNMNSLNFSSTVCGLGVAEVKMLTKKSFGLYLWKGCGRARIWPQPSNASNVLLKLGPNWSITFIVIFRAAAFFVNFFFNK